MDASASDQQQPNPAAPAPADSIPTPGESPRSAESLAGGFLERIRNSIGSTNDTNGRGTTILPLFRQNSGLAPRPDAKDGADAQPEKDAAVSNEVRAPPTPLAAKLRITAKHRPPLHLLTLPPEIHILFLEQLELVHIEQLRCACLYFKNLVTRQLVRSIFGEQRLKTMLFSYCRLCSRHDPSGRTLLNGRSGSKPGSFVLCIWCAHREGHADLRGGARVMLGNGEKAWLCPLCGRPAVEVNRAGHPGGCLHLECLQVYNRRRLKFGLLGVLQMSLGIVAVALAWRYFRGVLLVFAPTVTSFLLVWVSLVTLCCRSRSTPTYTYQLALLLELAILGLWIPPVYVITRGIAAAPGAPVPATTVAALLFFLLNMLFRLLNAIGNVIIWSEYDLGRPYRPGNSRWRRNLLDPLATLIIFWTFPAAIKRHYHHTCRVIRTSHL